ncbi:MAG TPA: MFS transporter [Vicinamibacterales bacterium]|nr:MFS transporter [Vicinamibacterales bacterium]
MTTAVATAPRAALFAAAAAGIFLFGIVLALLGTLLGLPATRARLQVDLAGQGDLLLLLYLGLWISTTLVGPFIDRFGNRRILIVSSALVCGALVGLAAARSFAAGGAAAVLLGLGGGGLNTSSNALVSSVYGAERGRALNLLGLFFGFGALSMPLVTASLTAVLPDTVLLAAAAALAAACLVAFASLRFPPAEASRFSLGDALRLAREPGVLLFAALLFCQSGNEAAVGGWISSYVGAMGWSPRLATWVLTGYWAAIIAGRIAAARLLGRVAKPTVVFAGAAGSAAAIALLLAARSAPALAIAGALTGLSFASIYPTTLAMAGDRYPRFAGTLFGLLFSIALVGGMIFPWAIGRLSRHAGLRVGMVLPIAGALAICALVTIIGRRERETRRVR